MDRKLFVEYGSKRQRGKGRNRGSEGFTLLELLVAIALSALIALIMSQALSLSIRAREAGEKRSQADQRARIILNKLSTEIASAYFYRYKKKQKKTSLPNSGTPEGAERLAFRGSFETISFISSVPVADHEENSGGLKEVSIFTSGTGTKGSGQLYILEKKLDPVNPLSESESEPGEESIYSDLVAKLSFRYLTVTEKKAPAGNTFFTDESWEESYNHDPQTSKNNHLIGVEILLSIFEPEADGVEKIEAVEYPPLFVRVHANQEIMSEKEST